jgi:hypothetical protein
MITVVLTELSRLFMNACCMLRPQPQKRTAMQIHGRPSYLNQKTRSQRTFSDDNRSFEGVE